MRNAEWWFPQHHMMICSTLRMLLELGLRVNAAHEEILHILRKTIKNVVTVPIKPIKPIPKLQNAVTVPKKTKKPIPQESWRLGGSASGLRRNWFYWFFWYSFSIWQLWDWFYWFSLVQTNKTNPDSAKCWNCTKKTKKNNPSGVFEIGRLGLRTPGGLVLLVFLVQFQHLATLGLVLLVFLSKNQ